MDNIARTGTWLGLNRAPYVRDGEFTKMKNLSSDSYPYMATRKARKKHTYSFSVKGVPGDGYEAEVQTLPAATAETEGEVYLLNPSFSGFKAGKLYYKTVNGWKEKPQYEGAYVINDNLIFYGTYEEFPKRINNKECFEGVKIYRDSKRANDAIDAAKNNSRAVIRNIARKNDYQYQFINAYGIWKEYEGSYYSFLISSAEKMEEYVENPYKYSDNRIGKYFKYIGESTDKYVEGKIYELTCAVKTTWKEFEKQIILAVADVPEKAEEGTIIKFCGKEQPSKGKNYEALAEIDPERNVFYYWQKTNKEAEEERNTELPLASADSKIIKYTGDSEATFFECVYDGEKYDWKVTNQPYVTKNLTIKEYIDKYVGEFQFKEIMEIHAHDGEIAALIKSTENDVYMFVNKAFYKQSSMNSSNGKTLTSVGRKIICGGTGSYYDSKDDKYYEGAGMFEFTLQCNVFETFSGKQYVTKAEMNKIVIYAENENELTNIANALNKPGTEFEMSSEKQAVKYPYTTSDKEENCKIEFIGWGQEIGGIWVQGSAYKLTIDIVNVPETFVREFPEEEIRITSPSRSADTITWKNRLWSYSDNYLIGSIAGIFNGKDIIWNEVNNNYNDSISQPIWQGGVINSIIPFAEAIIIFKDDNISVFSGETIPTMSLYTVSCPGLKKENAASAVYVNDNVYYYSDDGVYRFSGGFPTCVSEDLKFKGSEAKGGTDGKKYYLSIIEEGERRLYVYDIKNRVWHKEDNFNAISFTVLNGNVYMTDGVNIFSYEDVDKKMEWEAEFTYDEDVVYKKKYKQLIIRGTFEECEVCIKADNNEWSVAVLCAGGKIKIPPFVCEKLTIKLKGHGKAEIRSVDRVYEIIE